MKLFSIIYLQILYSDKQIFCFTDKEDEGYIRRIYYNRYFMNDIISFINIYPWI